MKWVKLNCPDPFKTDPPKTGPNGYKLPGRFKWIKFIWTEIVLYSLGQFPMGWDSFDGTVKWLNSTEQFDSDRDSFFHCINFIFFSFFVLNSNVIASV